MPNTIIQADAPDGLTLTLKLYAVNGDTLLNGSGDAMTERTNNKGTYTATVTEALTGVHEVRLTDANDVTVAKYVTEVLVDDTGTYRCHDFTPLTITEILTTQMTESYAADGVAPTLAQALFLIQQTVGDFSVVDTDITVKKIDGVTTAAVFILNDATIPTSRTRSS
jgi:hypothetical protein